MRRRKRPDTPALITLLVVIVVGLALGVLIAPSSERHHLQQSSSVRG